MSERINVAGCYCMDTIFCLALGFAFLQVQANT